MTPEAPVPGLEPAFTVEALLGPLEDHGVTRAGHRRVVAIAGGRVSGLFVGPAAGRARAVAVHRLSGPRADTVSYTAYRVT